jgi:F-type H+-transporting ATPase subunit b
MEAIFTTFGIEWKLLLIQGVNFGILLFGLWYFLYAPVLKMLEERRSKVTQGVVDAKRAQEKLAEIEQTRVATLSEAGREADSILSQAASRGVAKEREMLAQAQTAAANLVKEAEAQALEAKARAVSESKEEVAKLIVLGMEKMLANPSSGRAGN